MREFQVGDIIQFQESNTLAQWMGDKPLDVVSAEIVAVTDGVYECKRLDAKGGTVLLSTYHFVA